MNSSKKLVNEEMMWNHMEQLEERMHDRVDALQDVMLKSLNLQIENIDRFIESDRKEGKDITSLRRMRRILILNRVFLRKALNPGAMTVAQIMKR